MKKFITLLLIILAALIVLPLAYNNAQDITFNYVLGTQVLPLSWLTFGAFITGVVISLVFFAITGFGWKLRAKSLSKQVDELLKQRKREEIANNFNTKQ